MTVARRKLISLDVTPWYHCTCRCVRRSFLCGTDEYTNRNFSHRKAWIEELLFELTNVFCIDVAAYAVMSNHYHVVLKVDLNKANSLSDLQVIERLRKIYRGSQLIQRLANGDSLTVMEKRLVKEDLSKWRQLLTDVGRFMGYINQTIARRANKEDDCTGRFWEGRFSSQAILDEASLIRTMCYVDLNPIRAKQTNSVYQSAHTSISQRLGTNKKPLIPFCLVESPTLEEEQNKVDLNRIPMTLQSYCQLLEWTARELKMEKNSRAMGELPVPIEGLGYSQKEWLSAMQRNKGWRQKALGSLERIKEYVAAIGQRWIWVKQ